MQKLEHLFGDDGAFWMSYEDLLKKYQTFDRTRFFDADWKVTQQWTSLKVPWTADYQDTKFSFTLEKKAPVVIVLSQVTKTNFELIDLTDFHSLMDDTFAALMANTASSSHSESTKLGKMIISSAVMAITGCGDQLPPNSHWNMASITS